MPEQDVSAHRLPTRTLHERLTDLDGVAIDRDTRSEPSGAAQSPPTPPRRPLAASTLRASARLDPGLLDSSLAEAKSYIRITFCMFLASIAVVFLLAVIAAIAFVAKLASGAEWQGLAVVGGFSLMSTLILCIIQYRPAKGYGLAAPRVAQLEAKRTQINKSFELWERFLGDAEAARTLTAADVATAVASLTSATDGMMREDTAEASAETASNSPAAEPNTSRRLAPYTFLRRHT